MTKNTKDGLMAKEQHRVDELVKQLQQTQDELGKHKQNLEYANNAIKNLENRFIVLSTQIQEAKNFMKELESMEV